MSILFNHNHLSWLMSRNEIFDEIMDSPFVCRSLTLSLFCHDFVALKVSQKRRRQRDTNTQGYFWSYNQIACCTSCQMNYLSQLFAFRLHGNTMQLCYGNANRVSKFQLLWNNRRLSLFLLNILYKLILNLLYWNRILNKIIPIKKNDLKFFKNRYCDWNLVWNWLPIQT